MIKRFIKEVTLRIYFNIWEKHIQRWINEEKTSRLKKNFKHVGDGFSIVLPHLVYNAHYISIGRNFNADKGLRMEAIDQFAGQNFSPEISIGDNVMIIANCHIGCIDKVQIGNNVLIASNVYISDHSHGMITADALKMAPMQRPLYSKGPVIIHDNVWIGEHAVILPGVEIDRKSVV